MEQLKIDLTGRIDTNNSTRIEEDLINQIENAKKSSNIQSIILDATKLDYISSAGLRVVLKIKKKYKDIKIINVNNDVYEIFEVTGFSEIIPVERAYKTVDITGCDIVGEGANGKVYRINEDTVVKVYKNSSNIEEIRHEQEVAKLAFVLGVPTAISYNIVRVGDSYGSMFELLDANSFAKIIANRHDKIDWCVKEYIDTIKGVHNIEVAPGKLPHIKEKKMTQVKRMKHLLTEEYANKIESLIDDIPDSNYMIHGDYHTKNIVLSNGEVLLIDMDTLSVGHPIFELAQMYNSYIGFSESNPETVEHFQGYSDKIAREFWDKSLRQYFNTDDKDLLESIESKIRCISYASMIDWISRHKMINEVEDKKTLEIWKNELIKLLDRVDTLKIDLPEDVQGGGIWND